jgi:AraC family transcriptional regulator
MLTPTFRDHPTFRLAGLRRFHTFADAPRDIPKQWAEFNQLPIPGLHATKIFYGATCQTDTATLHNTWQYIWKQWLPTSGLKPAPTPDFECYDERFDPFTGEGSIEIWFPIQRQSIV